MKWIGQHIWDFISRFRSDVYFEDLSTTTESNILVVDSDGKVSKRTASGLTSGKVTVTDSSAVTSFPVVFHDESDGLLDDTGSFEYVPGTTTLYMQRSGGGAIDLSEIADNSTDFHIHMRNTKGGNAGDDSEAEGGNGGDGGGPGQDGGDASGGKSLAGSHGNGGEGGEQYLFY